MLCQANNQTDTSNSNVRYQLIDIVRGFALYGIFVANIIWTGQMFALTDVQIDQLSTANIDSKILFFNELFISSKFYSIFSMLFGLGFAIQINSPNFKLNIYLRRLFLLFLFGVVHAILLWHGDILHTYALLGIALVLLRTLTTKALITLTIIMTLITWLFPVAIYLGFNVDPDPEPLSKAERYVALTSGSWFDIIYVNCFFLISKYIQIDKYDASCTYWYLSIFWKFLFGFLAGKFMLLQKPEIYLRWYKALLPWFLVIGILGNGIIVLTGWYTDVSLSDYSSLAGSLNLLWCEISYLCLTLGYICSIVFLFQQSYWKNKLSYLAPVGRMALTNYLAQSIIMVFLLYGIGFNLLGKLGAFYCFILATLFFIMQIMISKIWLNHFKYGPMEWLWRSLTYKTKLQLRIN